MAAANLPGVLLLGTSKSRLGSAGFLLPPPEPPHAAGRMRRLKEKEFISRDRKASLELRDMG